jgi:hypothetical protein
MAFAALLLLAVSPAAARLWLPTSARYAERAAPVVGTSIGHALDTDGVRLVIVWS